MRRKSKPEEIKSSSLLWLVEQRKQSKKKQRKNEPQEVPDLPEKCIFNIIVRLPLESLPASKLVCKSWYRIVSSPYFIDAHIQRSDIGLIFLKEIRNDSSLAKIKFSVEYKSMGRNPPLICRTPSFCINFMKIKDGRSTIKEYSMTCAGRIKATCNGLIILENRSNRGGLIILNPITMELETIPLGTISSAWYDSYGFGFCRESRKYKLVHLFRDKLDYTCCEIMDMGSGSWREVDGPTKEYFYWSSNANFARKLAFGGPIRNVRRYPSCSPVFAMGALHWVPKFDRNEYMVSMSLNDEKFKKIPFPIICGNSDDIFQMSEFLGFSSHQEGNRVDVWMLRGLDGVGWEKLYSMDASGAWYMVRPYYGRLDGELVFKGGDSWVYVYDPYSRLTRKIEMIGSCSYFTHVNSLVSWRR